MNDVSTADDKSAEPKHPDDAYCANVALRRSHEGYLNRTHESPWSQPTAEQWASTRRGHGCDAKSYFTGEDKIIIAKQRSGPAGTYIKGTVDGPKGAGGSRSEGKVRASTECFVTPISPTIT